MLGLRVGPLYSLLAHSKLVRVRYSSHHGLRLGFLAIVLNVKGQDTKSLELGVLGGSGFRDDML